VETTVTKPERRTACNRFRRRAHSTCRRRDEVVVVVHWHAKIPIHIFILIFLMTNNYFFRF